MRHHAFVIEAGKEEGTEFALAWCEREFGIKTKANPDIVVLRYGLLSVDDARRVTEVAAQAPFMSDIKVIIVSANRAYYEAQNVLLKLFEEPPAGTYLFLILPSAGMLLPTLHSRVQILQQNERPRRSFIPEAAEEFIKANKEKRSVMIKKLATGKDEDERRKNRDTAIAIVNGVEAAAYESLKKRRTLPNAEEVVLFSTIQIVRGYLHDRSAPVRMILEHLSLILPKHLV